MGVYSFLDVQAAIKGPGGSFSLGNGAGAAEEGITVEMTDDKNSMVIGADGSGQHNLHAGKSGTIAIRLLKTSPTNALLSDLYNYQTQSSAYHGQNTISIRNPVSGDSITAQQCAFRRLSPNSYAKDGATMEWVFDAIRIDQKLGSGQLAV